MGNSNSYISQRSRYNADTMSSQFSSFKMSDDSSWGYTRDQGPDTWWVYYPNASGTHQSPIDIDPSIADFDSDLAAFPLKISYRDTSSKLLWNTGHGCQITIKEKNSHIRGGPLKGRYMLEQFHFHWGEKDDCGSEHTVNNQPYSAEVHFVHWNCDKYSSYTEASEQSDGLAVLAVFMQVSHSTNQYLKHVTKELGSIPYKCMGKNFLADYNPNVLLPGTKNPDDCTKYWVYQGSLTTPPCNESVTWIVFYEPIGISSDQLASFRSLRSYKQGERKPLNEHGGYILESFRPIQTLGNRRITTMEHVFTSRRDFDEQFHKQGLFLTSPEMMCQQQRCAMSQKYNNPAKVHAQPWA